MPAGRRRVALVAATERPMMTSYEAGLSMFPDLDGVHPVSRYPVGRLGLDMGSLVSMIPGGGVVNEGIGSIGAVQNLIGQFTGGNQNDQRRQARANWVVDQAKRGSVLAAEMIIAAPSQVSGNERTMWTNAIGQVPQTVLQQAYTVAPSGWWPVGDHSFDADNNAWQDSGGPVHAAIVQQVNAASHVGTAVGSAVAGGVSAIGGVPSWVWVGGLAVAGFAFLGGRRRRS